MGLINNRFFQSFNTKVDVCCIPFISLKRLILHLLSIGRKNINNNTKTLSIFALILSL